VGAKPGKATPFNFAGPRHSILLGPYIPLPAPHENVFARCVPAVYLKVAFWPFSAFVAFREINKSKQVVQTCFVGLRLLPSGAGVLIGRQSLRIAARVAQGLAP